jgi:hypothetical protein
MSDTNYYCAGTRCRRTTRRVRVRMGQNTYYYCVECGRRLEVREEQLQPEPRRKTG